MLLVVLALVLHLLPTTAAAGCISNYQELRDSLLSSPQNIDNLLATFYPPNQSPAHVLNVHYCLEGADKDCHLFRWVDSSVLLLIDVELFGMLSFNIANLAIRNVSIVLDEFCHDEMAVELLDLATVWLRSYAVGKGETDRFYSLMYHKDEAKFALASNDSYIHKTVQTLICFEYSAVAGALVVLYSILAATKHDKFQPVGKIISDIGIPSMGIMLYIVARDFYVYSNRFDMSQDWLQAFPFPIIVPSSFLINLIMSCLVVAFITDHFSLPSILVIFSLPPCEKRLQKCIKMAVQIALVFSVTNLLVLFFCHFAWVVLAFAAYPIHSIGSLAFAVPVLVMALDLFFLLDFIADARVLCNEFGGRVKKLVFTLFVVVLLGPFFIAIVGVLYCYSKVIVDLSDSRDYPLASLIVGTAPNIAAAAILSIVSQGVKAFLNRKYKQREQALLENEDDQKMYDSD